MNYTSLERQLTYKADKINPYICDQDIPQPRGLTLREARVDVSLTVASNSFVDKSI